MTVFRLINVSKSVRWPGYAEPSARTWRCSSNIIMLPASKRIETVGVRPSVCLSICPVFFLTLIEPAAHTHNDSPGAPCDAASVHFGPSIRRTDIRVGAAVKNFSALYFKIKMLMSSAA